MKSFSPNTLLLTLLSLVCSSSAKMNIAFKLGLQDSENLPGQAATNALERIIDWSVDWVNKEAGGHNWEKLDLPSAILPSKLAVNKPSSGASSFSGVIDAAAAESWKAAAEDLVGSWHSFVAKPDGTVILVDDGISEEDSRRLREEAAQQALPLPQGERHLQHQDWCVKDMCWFMCVSTGKPLYCDCCNCCGDVRRRLRNSRGLEALSDEDLQDMAIRIKDIALFGLHHWHHKFGVFEYDDVTGYILEVILQRNSDGTTRSAAGDFEVIKKEKKQVVETTTEDEVEKKEVVETTSEGEVGGSESESSESSGDSEEGGCGVCSSAVGTDQPECHGKEADVCFRMIQEENKCSFSACADP